MRQPFPMNCDDVIRTLAAPGTGRDESAVAEHLAACPPCAALSRIWEATRPAEPSDDVWEDLWARVSERLDQPEPAAIPIRRRSWGRTSTAVFVVGQAAAVLAAFVLLLGRHPADTDAPGPIAQATLMREVVLPTGVLPLVESNGQIRTADYSQDNPLNSLDPAFDVLNALESMAMAD